MRVATWLSYLFKPRMIVLVLVARPLLAASPVASHATIQELMLTQVDPAADAIWDSVSAETTAAGTQEYQPHTAQEWGNVRNHTLALIEAARLLMVPGRRVADPGRKTDDANIAGIETPPNIEKAIRTDPQKFVAAAGRLRSAGERALAAVDAKNPTALLAAGGQIDAACEACHLQYWYPHARRPGE